MKKLIRLFIALFCIFFLLQAMPGNVLPALRTFLHRTAQAISESTLLLAEKIDSIMEKGEDGQPAGSGGGGLTDSVDKDGAPAEEAGAEQTDGNHSGRTASEAAEEAGTDSSAGGQTDPDGEGETPGPSPEEAASDIFYYYYTKISREERLLYDAMLALANSPEAGSGAEEARLLSLNPSSDEFAESYTRAYNALVSDHPELFWIAQGRAKYECRYYVLPSFGGQYKIFLSLADASGAEEEEDGDVFRKYRGEQKELEEAAYALLDRIDMTQPDEVIALRLHDLLLDSAWYNTEAGPDDYAHTAYGALVEDSSGSPGGALCDGYALAYEYLLQRAGITSTMVCGYAGSSESDTEKHAWNLVLLDDDWYEVDATWDDLDFVPSPVEDGYDLLLEALSDEDYMLRIRHYMFNRTTEQMRSFTPGEEYRYTSYDGWVTLLQPSVHIRFTSDESEWTRDYVTPLAPEAEGTRYNWETVNEY